MARSSKRRTEKPSPFVDAIFIIFGALGVIAIVMAGVAVSDAWEISAREADLGRLPDVSRVAPGETAILDGRIAESVPKLRAEFAAYRREERAGRSGWRFFDQAKQPLVVERGTRTYTIGNDDYAFDRVLRWTWTDSRRDNDTAPSWTQGGLRIEGVVPGGPVMAVGQLVPENGTLMFKADSVVGLTRAQYLARLSDDYIFQWKFAGVLVLIGVLCLRLAWWGIRRQV